MAAELTRWVLKPMQHCSEVNQLLGIVTLQAVLGELDFDNATDANFDGTYEFSVTYTAGTESVTENVKLTITDTAKNCCNKHSNHKLDCSGS